MKKSLCRLKNLSLSGIEVSAYDTAEWFYDLKKIKGFLYMDIQFYITDMLCLWYLWMFTEQVNMKTCYNNLTEKMWIWKYNRIMCVICNKSYQSISPHFLTMRLFAPMLTLHIAADRQNWYLCFYDKPVLVRHPVGCPLIILFPSSPFTTYRKTVYIWYLYCVHI